MWRHGFPGHNYFHLAQLVNYLEYTDALFTIAQCSIMMTYFYFELCAYDFTLYGNKGGDQVVVSIPGLQRSVCEAENAAREPFIKVFGHVTVAECNHDHLGKKVTAFSMHHTHTIISSTWNFANSLFPGK